MALSANTEHTGVPFPGVSCFVSSAEDMVHLGVGAFSVVLEVADRTVPAIPLYCPFGILSPIALQVAFHGALYA